MNLTTMTDTMIIEALSKSLDIQRRTKKLTETELASKGGYNAQSYNNFINNAKDIKFSTLIKILRGLGELEQLLPLLENKTEYSPTGKNKDLPKRIRHRKQAKSTIVWGDEDE